MENKIAYQQELFKNRISKKYKELRKWARKNRVSCYRIYDRDIPEIPVSLDLYEFLPTQVSTPMECARFLSEQNARLSANDHTVETEIKERTYAVLYLYERPYEKSDEEEQIWLDAMSNAVQEVLQIQKTHIIQKFRKHQTHKEGSQYKKNDNDLSENTQNSQLPIADYQLVQECGQIFKINLSSYLDNGLFFDHRPLRNTVRETCSNKDVLNLFCYTGSFSVYAAAGNAKSVESVDLSNTYLDWAKENMLQNGFDDKKRYIFTRADCMAFLQEKAVSQKAVLSGNATQEQKKSAATYDLIILDPPTFSNSKNTHNVLDINRDWPQLVKDCLNLLNPNGVLYFSTNSERLKFDPNAFPQVTVSGHSVKCEDITASTIPNDYSARKPHRTWKFTVQS